MKRELYYRIAAAATPTNVRYVRVLTQRELRKEKARGWAAFDKGNVSIAACVPNTIYRLMIYLHECEHIRNHFWKFSYPLSHAEAVADIGAIRRLEKYGLTVPLRWLVRRYNAIDGLSKEDGGGRLVKRVLREIASRSLSNFNVLLVDGSGNLASVAVTS